MSFYYEVFTVETQKAEKYLLKSFKIHQVFLSAEHQTSRNEWVYWPHCIILNDAARASLILRACHDNQTIFFFSEKPCWFTFMDHGRLTVYSPTASVKKTDFSCECANVCISGFRPFIVSLSAQIYLFHRGIYLYICTLYIFIHTVCRV